MSSEDTSPGSKAELNEELKALLISAYEEGLDVEGAFECRNGMDHPDWDVVVTEVTKREQSE
jgi:hypothetical protein